jgi:hypothetical protein
MYKYQLAILDRMFNFITQDERFKSLGGPLQGDIILSFFMRCYHLKDWLKSSGVNGTKLDDYIEKTDELKICAKITNSTKHLSETDPRSPQLFPWVKQGLPSPISRAYNPFAEYEEEREYLEIMTLGYGDLPPRCFDFMRQCIEKWNKFLDDEGIDRNVDNLFIE